jgi:hypothetical protein
MMGGWVDRLVEFIGLLVDSLRDWRNGRINPR